MSLARIQSCLSSGHVPLEVNFKFLLFASGNVIFKLVYSIVKVEFSLSWHFFFSCCPAIDERMAYTLYSRFNCSRTLFWSNIRRGPSTTKVSY